MKKMLIVVAILVVSLAFFQTSAMAKTIKGMVLDVEASTITVAPDAEEGSAQVPEDVKLGVSPETKYTGVTSGDELMIGDEVVVEAEAGTEPNSWKAASVELIGLEDVDTEGAAPTGEDIGEATTPVASSTPSVPAAVPVATPVPAAKP